MFNISFKLFGGCWCRGILEIKKRYGVEKRIGQKKNDVVQRSAVLERYVIQDWGKKIME